MHERIIQTLLSEGLIICHENVNLSEINTHLVPIGYEVVKFPHKDLLVLKDRRKQTTGFLLPWKEKSAQQAKEIIHRISQNNFTKEEGPVLEMLIRYNYVRRDGEKLHLTERSLVQFGDHIKGKFSKCELCGFLTDDGKYHKGCGIAMQNKTKY